MPHSGIDSLAPVAGLAVTLTDGVLSVTIDRPDSLNSLTVPVITGLADVMERAATDPGVRVVRLGGAGRGFCSGAGISADDTAGGVPPDEIVREINRLIRAIAAVPHPVVAVVQGPAAGVGVSIALTCDVVLASEKAFFLLAFTKIGLMPDGGASALVAAAVGRIRAMRMALLPERLPAAEALEWGLVTAVYPPDEFDAEVDKVIARLLAGPAVAFAKTKQAINAATLTELDPALQRELEGQAHLLVSHDFKEGTTAFQEHRAPTFVDH
ncbi:enoyl-CoA hydratase [Mycobacterium sp. Marseille-P9652]|uniref:enoyl-CoA hydratase n=1 Tax=Mycobacterium sp. Marseille-P9652 TaxID=2654950 RepID=UPI0012E87109|nr:enoyl-CoA hydratase [Mycobacterium sp. Marseille-P9652]